MGFRYPDEQTTPEQWQVIAWASILLFIVVGGVGFYFSLQAPPDKIELARQLRCCSLGFWGLAAGIYTVKRLIGFFLG